MKTPLIALVVAVARNGVIGRDQALTWRLRDDLALFKQTTLGHPVVMGRKTMEALGCKPLPGRANLVVSSNPVAAEGFTGYNSLEAALAAAAAAPGGEVVCVIGGGQSYRQGRPVADVVYMSRVEAEPEGDTTFPDLDPHAWALAESTPYPQSERNDHAFAWQVWRRVQP